MSLPRNFLYLYKIKMGKVLPKLRQVFKLTSMVLLIGISIISWQAGTELLKFKRILTYDAASTDSIVVEQERSRVRVFFDAIKRISFTDWEVPGDDIDVQLISRIDLKSLFISAYQRNVFYVYASFSVP